MNQGELVQWLQGLIQSNNLHEFYTSSAWLKLRAEVLAEHKIECQDARQEVSIQANHVHHVQYVKKHAQWAFSRTYSFEGKEYKNLIPLCHDCHEKRHGYRQKEKKKPLTEERW